MCFEHLVDYAFLNFLFRLKDLHVLHCRFDFSRPNLYVYSIYYQLERSGGQEYGENPTNGLND